MQWDIFCKVIDNFGDIGVCWRLACNLAERGEQVRLFIDDASALAWMAPAGHASVAVCDWAEAETAEPSAVVLETFGCELPSAFVGRMNRQTRHKPLNEGHQNPTQPIWINLEYLSAEPYAQRSHGLPSPQLSGPGAGLNKWFFYPGFAAASGGLLREADLPARQQRFDRNQWLAAAHLGITPHPAERIVSLFCYDNPQLPSLLAQLAREPTLLLTCPGAATQLSANILGSGLHQNQLRSIALPWLSHVDYDHLLWSCDLNLVRGEDSFVRAQWAGKPMIWQIYPQNDGVHARKLDAFLDLYLSTEFNLSSPSHAEFGRTVRETWHHWNGLKNTIHTLPEMVLWREQSQKWHHQLVQQTDLTHRLMAFAHNTRARNRTDLP
jgi:uncharacterized repeat protein (TIGR03837 family)